MSKVLHVSLGLMLVLGVIAHAAPTASAQTPVQLRIFVGLGTGADPNQRQGQLALAEVWNSANPDIQISFEFYDNQTAYDTLLTQIAGANPPDLVGPAGIRAFSELGSYFADLSPLIERDQAELRLDDYDTVVLGVFNQAGGKTLALALGIYPSMMFVNEDLFAQAGLPLPPKEFGQPYIDRDGRRLPWDWNTVADLARQLTRDVNGVYADQQGFDVANTESWGFADYWVDFRNVAVRFGPSDAGVAADGRTATFDQPAFIEAAQWYHTRIYEDNSIPDKSEQDNKIGTTGLSPFESGKLAMWYGHSWYATCCMSRASFKVGVYPAPAVPGSQKVIAPLHADTFAIAERSPNREAAWKVLKWLNSAPIAERLASTYGFMPARKSIRRTWEQNTIRKLPWLDLKIVNASAAYADVPSHESALPNQAAAKKVYDAFWTALQRDPNMNVSAALKALNRTLQGIYDGTIQLTPTPVPSGTPAP